jgi:hypothetical protein
MEPQEGAMKGAPPYEPYFIMNSEKTKQPGSAEEEDEYAFPELEGCCVRIFRNKLH